MNVEMNELEVFQQEIITIFQSDLSLQDKREKLDLYHDLELAQTIMVLEPSLRLSMTQLLPDEMIAHILVQLSPEDANIIVRELPKSSLSSILNAIQPDDLADILQAMEERDERITYLSYVDIKKRQIIRNLLEYDDKVVGSIMNTNYVALQKTMTVKQAIKELVKVAPTVEFINNLYVIDNGRLVGVLSLKEIMAHGNLPDVMINDIMSVNLITVEPMTPNEEAIIEMQNYDFMLLPVVDKSGHMMGIVSFDDMDDIINEESDEDYSRLAGISDVNLDEKGETILISVKKRIPWLIILLFINLFTSTIIAGYEHVLVQITTLAIFMPLILNMAGNSGTQSLGVIIRLFATNQLTEKSSVWKHLLRELVTGLFNGLVIGILLFGIVIGLRMLDGSSFQVVLPFALVISLSIFVALAVSTLAGAIIPLIMKLCKIDPAVASGPFITTVNDIISLLLYFGLASAFLLPLL